MSNRGNRISWGVIILLIGAAAASFVAGVFYSRHQEKKVAQEEEAPIYSETPTAPPNRELTLNKYALSAIDAKQCQPSPITIEDIVADEDDYWSVIFSYMPEGKKMTGLMNIPKNGPPTATLLMLRGWAPNAGYASGTGTKNASLYYVKNGNYLTVAPDFFGYGDSDSEPADTWQARFEKPVLVIDLINSLRRGEVTCSAEKTAALENKKKLTHIEEAWPAVCQPEQLAKIKTTENKLGLWGHSNGGQIAVSVLETLKEPLPTTLWAPVTAPFPYSILFFSDENEDEGKEMRKWVAMFEEDYDVFDFNITSNLDLIASSTAIQLHHGTADEAALISWSDEFEGKLAQSNKKRPSDQSVELAYYRYPGADHNLKPSWDIVVKRDLDFFNKKFAE